MKLGDFSRLAKDYRNRAGYSDAVVDMLVRYVHAGRGDDFTVADVGAGTGKFTEMLLSRGINCIAIEPNDEMREEGIHQTRQYRVRWQKGSGEATGLADQSVDWLTMASSFHWVNLQQGLKEFSRVLKPGGFFTALWNPRNITVSPFHTEIESMIKSIVPDLKRVSSGSGAFTDSLAQEIAASGLFKDVVFLEAEHEVVMTPERYLGAWQSVNDIQSQAGPERWQQIMENIKQRVKPLSEVHVPYKTRAWTARKV